MIHDGTKNTNLTTQEVAERLGVTAPVVAKKCGEGAFPGAFNIGGRSGWRIPVEGVEAYKASRGQRKPVGAVVKPTTKHGRITI